MRANRETLSKALRAAVPKSLPVCVSFLFLALSYGVLMGTKGFSFVWPMCMSAFIFTGSMEFVTVNHLHATHPTRVLTPPHSQPHTFHIVRSNTAIRLVDLRCSIAIKEKSLRG